MRGLSRASSLSDEVREEREGVGATEKARDLAARIGKTQRKFARCWTAIRALAAPRHIVRPACGRRPDRHGGERRRPARWRALRHGLVAIAALVASAAHAASGFFVLNAGTQLRDGVYRLSAQVRYELSEDVEHAIRNGIPVDLRLDIEILRPRTFMWSETVAELQQLYRIQFHALSRRYVATNINSGEQSDFDTLSESLVSLSEVADLPLIDRGLLEPDESYVVRLRADLDYGVLPVPLRYYAIALPSWRLTSEWYNFPLQ